MGLGMECLLQECLLHECLRQMHHTSGPTLASEPELSMQRSVAPLCWEYCWLLAEQFLQMRLLRAHGYREGELYKELSQYYRSGAAVCLEKG